MEGTLSSILDCGVSEQVTSFGTDAGALITWNRFKLVITSGISLPPGSTNLTLEPCVCDVNSLIANARLLSYKYDSFDPSSLLGGQVLGLVRSGFVDGYLLR